MLSATMYICLIIFPIYLELANKGARLQRPPKSCEKYVRQDAYTKFGKRVRQRCSEIKNSGV